MGLSENIRRIRLEKGFTQEGLGAKLGVSAQAVSKWETSETYPDGALYVPLGEVLGVSLDELFGNESVYMADVSAKIVSLLSRTEKKDRFEVARDVCWQIEKGLFEGIAVSEDKYDPEEIKNLSGSSYVLRDGGFTLISNGKEPFFSLFSQGEEGFGRFLERKDKLLKVFASLSNEATFNAIVYLMGKEENYVFESSVLARSCGISKDGAERVMEDLLILELVSKLELTVNGTPCTLYRSRSGFRCLALCLIADQIGFKECYNLQAHSRSLPLIKE